MLFDYQQQQQLSDLVKGAYFTPQQGYDWQAALRDAVNYIRAIRDINPWDLIPAGTETLSKITADRNYEMAQKQLAEQIRQNQASEAIARARIAAEAEQTRRALEQDKMKTALSLLPTYQSQFPNRSPMELLPLVLTDLDNIKQGKPPVYFTGQPQQQQVQQEWTPPSLKNLFGKQWQNTSPEELQYWAE